MGGTFHIADHALNSLLRIASSIEGSMYRAMRELERRNSERQETANDKPVIDVEADEEDWLDGL